MDRNFWYIKKKEKKPEWKYLRSLFKVNNESTIYVVNSYQLETWLMFA